MSRLFWCTPLLGLCLAALSLNATSAPPQTTKRQGISFHVLRVIYPASNKSGAAITAYNKTSAPFLMQSRIRPVDLATGAVDMVTTGAAAVPFIATPPLARLEANGDLTLRVRRNGQSLPTDRESVFYISMKAIPAQDAPTPAIENGKLVLTITNNIKVFYRPEGLAKRAVADMAAKLHFRREGNLLLADNPTPYWLTFSRLNVGTYTLSKAQLRLMVPPFGQQRYSLPTGATGTVSWQLIDEDGWDTPTLQRTL